MKKNKFLPRVLGAIMACVMTIVSMPRVNAAEMKTYTAYDDAGNAYTVNEGEVLGVLYDKYGNVKAQETISPYKLYVNGKKYTLDPGDYFITYQYEVSVAFYAGFYYYFMRETSPSTTPGGTLAISLQECATIGGERNTVYYQKFNTTYHEGDEDEYCEYGLSKTIGTALRTSSRPYYNARFENVGTKTITVCWCVGKD